MEAIGCELSRRIAALLFSSCAGTAQDQTLRIVFPFSAGGAADGIADAEAEALIVAASL
jgi:tripartite-type tricarboxylate transporter receptor subunit TctC